MARNRKNKKPPRAVREARKRRAAQGPITETRGNSALQTLPMAGESEEPASPVLTDTIAGQNGGMRALEHAPHIRKLDGVDAAKEYLSAKGTIPLEQLERIYARMGDIAETSEEEPNAIAAFKELRFHATLAAKLDKEREEQPPSSPPRGTETHIHKHDHVHLSPDGFGEDFLAIAAELGISSDVEAASESSRPEDTLEGTATPASPSPPERES